MKTDYVYIVEDDSIASYVITLELESHPSFSESKVFKNGKEALDELIKNEKENERFPDLILLDLNMPVMDGWEFLSTFSSMDYGQEISVIILTSSINPEDEDKSKSYSIVKGFLSKPLTAEKLNTILNGKSE